MKKFRAAKAIIVKDNKMLVLKKAEFLLGRGLKSGLDIPGGRYNPDEKPEDALKREAKEETGLDVIPKKILLNFDVLKNKEFHVNADGFLCELKDTKQKIKLSREHSGYFWYDLNESGSKLDGWLRDIFEKVKEETFLK